MFINEQYRGCSEAFFEAAYDCCIDNEDMFNYLCGMNSIVMD